MKEALRHSNYHPELDGLRAFAVIFVIINHFKESIMPGGYLGVDMFFLLSGYVVSSSLYNRPITNWPTFIAQFYARRMKRLLPALICCVLLTSLLGCLFIQYPRESLRAGKYALLGVSNIYLYAHSSDYFGVDALHNLFTHTWSLGVEEQFYILFPILLILRGFKDQKFLTYALVTLSTASFLLWLGMNQLNASFSFYMIFTRFWELGLGCLTFLLVINSTLPPLKKTFSVIAFLALVIIISIVFIPKEQLLLANAIMSLAVAVLIYFTRERNSVVRFMSNTWLVRIGVLSYSLYLWHWPVIVLSRHTIGINAHTIFFQILIIILLSLGSFFFIERPFRYNKIKYFDNSNVLVTAGLSTIVICCSLISILSHSSNRLFSADRPQFDLNFPVFSIDPNFVHCESSNQVVINQFPPSCLYLSGAKKTLWMVGDSTTWALKGLASELAKKQVFNIAMYAGDSAFPTTQLTCSDAPGAARCRDIKDFVSKTFNYIVLWSQPGDVVMITGNIGHEFCNYPELYCDKNKEVNKKFADFLAEMGHLKKMLGKKNVQLIISAPLPQWSKDHKIHCEKQWFKPSWENDKCNYPSYLEQEKSRTRLLAVINKAKDNYKFLVYDPFPRVCNETSCNFSNPKTNKNYWIDETHLSTLGGKRLTSDFNDFLQKEGLLG